MKHLFLTLFFISLMAQGFGQSYDCNDAKFRMSIDSLLTDADVLVVIKMRLDSTYPSDICKFKFYAYYVDKLFSDGLRWDIPFKVAFRDNSLMKGYVPKIDPNMARNMQFLKFIEVKKSFEYRFFNRAKGPEYQAIVNSILAYGIFNYPKKVEEFLRFKYKHVTKDKLYDDILGR